MTEKKVFSGHQPNFLPYMGVFYKVFKSDVFVLDDDVEYSSTGLHNSNYMKIGREKHKITIPTSYHGDKQVNEVPIAYTGNWSRKLLRTIELNYGKAAHFEEGYELLNRYIGQHYEMLADMNIDMFKEVSARFGFKAKIVIASNDVPTNLKKNERNVFQCMQLGCNVYYSGTGGREYNDHELYKKNGIDIVYSDYEPVKYRQVGYGFVENLSVLDYIMNEGFVIPAAWQNKQLDMQHDSVTIRS